MVNVFRRGMILTSQPDTSAQPIYTNPILYGTADGSLGVIAQIPDHIYVYVVTIYRSHNRSSKLSIIKKSSITEILYLLIDSGSPNSMLKIFVSWNPALFTCEILGTDSCKDFLKDN